MAERDPRTSAAARTAGGAATPPGEAPIPMVVGDPPAGTTTSDAPDDQPRTWPRLAVGAVGLTLAVVLVLSLLATPSTPRAVPGVPTDDVTVRWTDDVIAGGSRSGSAGGESDDPVTGEVGLLLVGDRLVILVPSATGFHLVQRSATTGEVAWRRELPAADLPVLLDGNSAVPGQQEWLVRARHRERLVGIDVVDGTRRWAVPIGDDFEGRATPTGQLLVSGNGRCGRLDPGSGRILQLRVTTTCLLRRTGTVAWTNDGWEVLDVTGRSVATVASTPAAPVLAAGTVVAADGAAVVVHDPAGQPRRFAVDADVQWLEPVGSDLVAVRTRRSVYALQVDQVDLHGPLPPTAEPIQLHDRVVVFDDGRFPPDPLVTSGVWSRSPDPNAARVLDLEGRAQADRTLVLEDPRRITDGGILLWDWTDRQRRLGLYGYEDLAPRWTIRFDGYPAAALVSGDHAVAVVWLGARGELQVSGLG